MSFLSGQLLRNQSGYYPKAIYRDIQPAGFVHLIIVRFTIVKMFASPKYFPWDFEILRNWYWRRKCSQKPQFSYLLALMVILLFSSALIFGFKNKIRKKISEKKILNNSSTWTVKHLYFQIRSFLYLGKSCSISVKSFGTKTENEFFNAYTLNLLKSANFLTINPKIQFAKAIINENSNYWKILIILENKYDEAVQGIRQIIF